MKLYVISVMLVGIIGSVVSVLAPEGGLKDHVKLAVGIVTVSVCILPLTSIVSEVQSLDIDSILGEPYTESEKDYESILQSEYEEAEIENLKSGIKSILKEKFSVEEYECEVSVTVGKDGDGKRELKRIFINFCGEAIWKNTSEIEDHLGGMFGCEVVTAVG